MPLVADVSLLARLLAHFGDLGMAIDGSEEAIDVDLAEAPRGRDMLLGREVLIADHDDAVPVEGRADAIECCVVDAGREVDAENLGAQRPRDRPDFHLGVSHRHVSR